MELAGESVDSRGNACRSDLEGVEGALVRAVEAVGVVGLCPFVVSTLR